VILNAETPNVIQGTNVTRTVYKYYEEFLVVTEHKASGPIILLYKIVY